MMGATTPLIGSVAALDQQLESPWVGGLRRLARFVLHNPLALAGSLIIFVWTVVILLGPWLIPYDPLAQNVANRLQAPNSQHLFGTDELGRDLFSRVMDGARVSLPMGILATMAMFALGTIVGAVAGYVGGLVEEILMRVADVFLAFPAIVLAMAVAAALGPGLRNGLLAIVVVLWPKYARLVRSLVLTVKETEYVTASRMIGSGHLRILTRAVLPNSLAPAVVMATLDIGNNVMVFSILSFIGLGAVPPSPEWGALVATGSQKMDQWWLATFPGLAIFSVTMAFNIIGDALRDAMDPLLRRA
jgi:peptide/nickel transport system permease protein